MVFAKSILPTLLCLITVSTSSQLGEQCVDSISGLEGRCEDYRKCDFTGLGKTLRSGYCYSSTPLSISELVCCPLTPFKGDKCIDSTTRVNGRCEYLSECNYALKYRKKTSDCYDSTVCCPSVQLRISEKMCFHYLRHMNYDYTEKDIRVDGVQTDNVCVGKNVLRKSSHLAIIGFSQNKKIKWRCGGSIISPFFVLSSAHCAKDVDLALAKWVRIKLYSPIKDAKHQHFLISKRFTHPDYASSSYYDIALFKLKKKLFLVMLISRHAYIP